MPVQGPRVMIRVARGGAMSPTMDLDAYVAEVIEGVSEANGELGSAVEVEEIEVVPDDFPRPGQVRHCAKMLVRNHVESSGPGAVPRCGAGEIE